VTVTDQEETLAITDPGHGDAFTDHLFSIDWTPEEGWCRQSLDRLENLSLHPATVGLHYGQSAFEGLKAHRRNDGTMAVFRPRDHARRFQRSARRLAMPELPEDLFVDAIDQLVSRDARRLSDNPAHSLYLRPLLFGADPSLRLGPSRTYKFLLMAFVADSFFGTHTNAVSVYISHKHARAFTGGTGEVKVAGNYAPTYLAQLAAEEAGCQQVVWLDAVEQRYVEEMSGMNLFLVRGSGANAQIVTPALTGTLLPGITRDTILRLAGRHGFIAVEERLSLDQWRRECLDGTITEAFACGTAAVVTPVGQVRDQDGDFRIGDGRSGPVTTTLRTALTDLHHGVVDDIDDWLHVCQ
jgi:branched-chain amino acid aminotransferase